MLAGEQRLDAFVEDVERDGEVPRVPSRRLETEPCAPQDTGAHERQYLEADERCC